MIYFSDKELDDLLTEDIYRGDLTTQMLGIGDIKAQICFTRKNAGIVAGLAVAEKLLKKLDLTAHLYVQDGDVVNQGDLLIRAQGRADRLHQAWKVVQLVLEWSCGVAQYTADMVANAKAVNSAAVIACTRKSIPNTRKLATAAVLAGGGHIHRQGLSETLLVFTNHRNLLMGPDDYIAIVARLKRQAPENKVILEADNMLQFERILPANPDIIQLDKFTPAQVKTVMETVRHHYPNIQIAVAGGVHKNNVAEYTKAGANLFVTSAPYYAPPEDIKVIIEKTG